MSDSGSANRYSRIIEKIFLQRHRKGARRVPFDRDDIERAAQDLGIRLPKNIGDVIYSFRFRAELPESVKNRAPKGRSWIIRLTGRSQYCFVAARLTDIAPRHDMALTKVPDATPGIIARYALDDEQALLAKLRYNRLIDIFTGITCYSLQSHLRTAVQETGQIETDEVYIGIDKRGVHYVLPIQAKGGRDRQSAVQIEQDFAMCAAKFPMLVCRPIAAQFMDENTIALFEFETQDVEIVIACEKHYQLVAADQLTEEELKAYQRRRDG